MQECKAPGSGQKTDRKMHRFNVAFSVTYN